MTGARREVGRWLEIQSIGVNQWQAVTQRQAADPGCLLVCSEPRSPSSACHGDQSHSTGLVVENIFSQSVPKFLHPKCMSQKGFAAPGSWHIKPGKGPKRRIAVKINTREDFNSSQTWSPKYSPVHPLYKKRKGGWFSRVCQLLENECGLTSVITHPLFLTFFPAVISHHDRVYRKGWGKHQVQQLSPVLILTKYQHRNPVQTMHVFVY